MESYKILISLVVLAACLSIGHSANLNCIQCESHEVKGCLNDGMNDTVVKNYTKPCDGVRDNVCMKIVAKATRTGWTGKNGMKEVASIKVSRFCAQMDTPKTKCTMMDGAAGYLTYCTCEGKACNSAVSAVASLLAIVSCFIAKMIL